MLLTDYLYGFIEDNAGFFAYPQVIEGFKGCTNYVGYPTGTCINLWQSNEPFIFIPAFLLAKILPTILAYNIIIIGGLVLNFIFAFVFFKKIFGRFIAFLLSLTFLFSPYFGYRARSHFDLIQFWPVIWFFYILFFSKSLKKSIYLGILATFILGTSNYLGYFTILSAASFIIWAWLLGKNKLLLIKIHAKNLLVGLGVFALSSFIFAAPYIKANFFTPKVKVEESANPKVVNRPLEDFIIFSSRPWYFFIPSVDNPFFGRISQSLLNKITLSGNYLTQNYFKSEHSTLYLGWINILLVSSVLLNTLFSKLTKKIKVPQNENENHFANLPTNLSVLILTIFTLLIFTLPPSINLNNKIYYTPSFLLYKAFPMFRVLSRLGVFILFFTLIIVGFGYKMAAERIYFSSNNQDAKSKRLKRVRLVLIFLCLFSICEFFIPVKITQVSNAPKVYAYLGKNDPFKSPIVVYPYSKSNEALFWLATHNKALINPRFYYHKETSFNSENFSKTLNSVAGLEKAKQMGAKYLIYFYEADQEKNIEFFSNAIILQQIGRFEESKEPEKNLSIIRIINSGDSKENSAILYKFR